MIFRKERSHMKEVVITSAVRTAIGNFLGALSPFSATELGGKVIEEAVKRSKIQKKDVDEVIMGNVLLLDWDRIQLVKP